jgi:hypothetical protein
LIVLAKDSAVTPPVEIDWYGKPLDIDFRFVLETENNLITFGAKFPKNGISLGSKGQFLKGLWEESVVELFVHELNSTRYVELNLSPTGAYWCAEFSNYRFGSSELNLTPKIETESDREFNTVSLQFDVRDLVNGDYKLAQTSVLSLGNRSESARLFLTRRFARGQSAKEVLSCDPDFHKKELAEVLSNYPPIS